tara:strand:+ start:62490 stop:63209 length:720 start_codon:yes stop_codon:yes gene_type:complete
MFSTIISCNYPFVADLDKINEKLPRRGFLFLKKSVVLHQCTKDKCNSMTSNSVASGFIVKIQERGSYAITAAHVCETAVPPIQPPVRAAATYIAVTADGRQYKAIILDYNSEIDMCMLFVEQLNHNVQAVKISNRAPAIGEKVYNFAAPRGIYRPGIVTLLEGRFNGNSGGVAWYTLPAAPGSSGSMIINTDGELVGMVHSVYIYFPMITLSTEFKGLQHFIEHNLGKHTDRFWMTRGR